MKTHIRTLSLLCFLTMTITLYPVRAFASNNCKTEVDDQVEDCDTITLSAEQANTDVATGMGGLPGNVQQGGENLSAVSEFGMRNLQAASQKCEKNLDKCKSACSSAFQSAKSDADQNQINDNLKLCQRSIVRNQNKLEFARAQLASASQAGQQVSDSANGRTPTCSGSSCDAPVADSEKYNPGEGATVTKTGSAPSGPAGGVKVIEINTGLEMQKSSFSEIRHYSNGATTYIPKTGGGYTDLPLRGK